MINAAVRQIICTFSQFAKVLSTSLLSETAMPIQWKKKQSMNPAVLLNAAAELRVVLEEGRASFKGMRIMDIALALESMLIFPPAADGVDRSDLVMTTLANGLLELNKSSFVTLINANLDKLLSRKQSRFNVLTTISLSSKKIQPHFKRDGVGFSFYAESFPDHFQSRPALLSDQIGEAASLCDSYTKVVLEVTAAGSAEAMHFALDAIDLERSFWSRSENPSGDWAVAQGKPVNKIRLGNAHTVHRLDGTLAGNGAWIDPSFIQAKNHIPNENNDLDTYGLNHWTQLNKCPYRPQLVKALLQYIRALDEPNHNTAFLQLWSAMETLLTPGHGNHDLMIKRCAFLFDNVDYNTQILEHLRDFRNTSVHAGDQSRSARQMCYQTLFYFLALTRFHLTHAGEFSSLDEVNEFLDLPTTASTLLHRQALIERAIKFRSISDADGTSPSKVEIPGNA